MPNPEAPDINIPLLRKTVEWVEEQEALKNRILENKEDESRWQLDPEAPWWPVQWVQATWFSIQKGPEGQIDLDICDTAYCFAGKIVVDAGWKPILTANDEPGVDYVLANMCEKDGVKEEIPVVAANLLGIPWDVLHNARYTLDAEESGRSYTTDSYLFSGDNNATTIRIIAERLAGERL